MDDSTKLIFYWILITLILSAIIGVYFAIVALFKRKTMEQSFYSFIYSLCGGFLGGLAGSLLGLPLGWIVSAIIPLERSSIFLIGNTWGKAIGFAMTFFLCWIIGIFVGGIKSGITYLNKGGN